MPRSLYMQKTINGQNPGTITGDLTVDGDVTITQDLQVDGDTNIDGALDVEDGIQISVGGLTVAGVAAFGTNVGIAGNLAVTGTSAFTGAVTLPAATTIGGSNPNLLTFSGTSGPLQTAGALSYLVAPRAGTIVGFAAATNAAITTGDATLGLRINGVAVTDGVVTLPLAGTAAGDPGYATPTALNVVALNDIISVIVGGTNATATSAVITVTMSY